MRYRIGIDVGGTNTDAALLDGRTVVAAVKRTTTADVTAGIAASLRGLLSQAEVPTDQIGGVMIGTTHFTNAVLQRKGLARTAALRLCLPAGQALPPFIDWPDELREAVGGEYRLLHGGFEFDSRPISALDEVEVMTAIAELQAAGVEAVAIAGIFSPLDAVQEDRVSALLSERAPEIAVTRSHDIGRLGLLERENAALLNASLAPIARTVIGHMEHAVRTAGLTCPLFLSQNDGTLMTAGYAARYPVLTFTSGPTNSMRGAALLSGIRDGVVIDVGGTSCDLGALIAGFPREASFEVAVGGVRTNFRMPDVVSVALGGGSIVSADGGDVGPVSVGYELTSRGRVFGGDTLTATDIGVAGGLAMVGDPALVRNLEPATVRRALGVIRERIETALDGVRTSADPVPVVAVGGGSFLVPDDLAGALRVERPAHYAVANAVGAALAQVSGEVDRVFAVDGRSRHDILAEAQREAEERATSAGADAGTLELVEVDEVPLAYLPSTAVRVRVKVVGDLRG